MNSLDPRWALLAGATLLAACGSEPNPPATADCTAAAVTTLAPGQDAIINAAEQGCARLPSAPAEGAEYLYFAGITEGRFSAQGTSAPYQLVGTGGPPAAAKRAAPALRLASGRQQPAALAFHSRLRDMERSAAQEVAALRSAGAPVQARVAVAPPEPGDKRTFNVLKDGTVTGNKSSDYVQVTGTVQYVGSHTAIYLDDAAPAPTFSSIDLQALGSMFNDQLYAIDTTAFGRESDIDGNGLVLILLTDRVTKLISCAGGSVIVGFFLPFDLSPSHVGSNAAEVFYGMVPDASCGIGVAQARDNLPPVMIHEFQHMISYNQHVLERGGNAEETWLNEGLSQFAEELGGRLVPDAFCTNNDCLTQFALFDLDNAQRYLVDPVSSYLIGPDRVPIPLEEYGAAWLFVRWLMDHYANTQEIGTDLTRALDQTSRTGVSNVEQATATEFSSLALNWQLANYLDNLPGFTPADPLLQYTSWDFRATYASLHAQNPGAFPSAFPLEPPTAPDGAFNETGTFRAGSGRHVLVEQGASGPELSLRLTGTDGTTPLPASVGPFVGIVRIR